MKIDPLVDGAWRNDLSAVRAVLESGGRTDRTGVIPRAAPHLLMLSPVFSALSAAAFHGNVRIAKLLLDAGAKVDQVAGLKQTPLHVAALLGHTEMVRFLLSRGADPSHRDQTGAVPLYRAVSHNGTASAPLVRALLRAGADPLAKDNYGNSFLQKASPELRALVGFLSPKAAAGAQELEWIVKTRLSLTKAAALLSDEADDPATLGRRFFERFRRPVTPKRKDEELALAALDRARAWFGPLLDLERQPPLKGLYAATIAEWAKMLRPSERLMRPKEQWKKREVRVSFVADGRPVAVTGRAYRSGHFDLRIVQALNDALPSKPRKLEVARTEHLDVLVIALSPKEKAALAKRKWRFFDAKAFDEMASVYEERER